MPTLHRCLPHARRGIARRRAWGAALFLALLPQVGSAATSTSTSASASVPPAHDPRLVGTWSLAGGTMTLPATGPWSARQGDLTATGPSWAAQAGGLTMTSSDPQDVADVIHYRFLADGRLEFTGSDGVVVIATRAVPPAGGATPAPAPASTSTTSAALPGPPAPR